MNRLRSFVTRALGVQTEPVHMSPEAAARAHRLERSNGMSLTPRNIDVLQHPNFNKHLAEYYAKKKGSAWNIPTPTILQRSNSARNFYGTGMEKASPLVIARRMKNANAQHGNGSLALEGLPFEKMIQGVKKYKQVYGPRKVLTREKLETKLKDAEARRQAVKLENAERWRQAVKLENAERRRQTEISSREKLENAARRRSIAVNSKRVPNKLKASVQKRDAVHAKITEEAKAEGQKYMNTYWQRVELNPHSGVRSKQRINQREDNARNRAVARATSNKKD